MSSSITAAAFSERAVGMEASCVHSSVGAGWALEVQDEVSSRRKVMDLKNNILIDFMDLKRIIASPFHENKKTHLRIFSSSTWTRTRNLAVNSRSLCRLSYRGR